jgi:hypothetical protein
LSVIVVIVQFALLAVCFSKIHTLESHRPAAQNRRRQAESPAAMTALSAISFNQPAVSVSDNKVYLPDMKLSLPLTDTAFTLLYSGRQTLSNGQTATVYDVTTRSLASLSPAGFQQRLACYPLRLAFEAKPNPFNPHEKDNSAVKLADDRTLQIYANDDEACAPQWQAANVKPDALEQAFEQATSY